MAFNFLQNKMAKAVKKASTKGMLSKENISEVLSEIRLILLDSDVNLKVVNDFIKKVSDKAIGQVVSVDRTASQTILKIINQELTNLLGGEVKEWHNQSLSKVMFVGLQGSGKTTSVAKLTSHLVNKKKFYKKPLLVALDVYRPAAIDQLEKLSKTLMVDFYCERDNKNVEKIAKHAMKYATKNGHDLIMFDTAGRLQTDENLMDELTKVKSIVKPSEIIFVADAMSGQEVLNVAKTFDDRLKLTSAIITKLDSDAKGGAALSLSSAIGLKIMYIGTGEKISNLEIFYPDRQAGRILGLGDIKTLTEKAQEISNESDQEKMMRKIMAGQFDLEDLLESISQMAKMGNISGVAKLLPGMKISETQINSAENKLNSYTILINSMTQKEKKNPKILKHPSRKKRVLSGSGRTIQEFNNLLRDFDKSQKQMKEMAKYIKMGKMPNMSGKFNNFR
ncbi:MAG: signal recognition particle protein [Candidatus Tyloplasma litorale]|nr:MAG: signal recognition particle protein [Mycoplasmatales bacterium]